MTTIPDWRLDAAFARVLSKIRVREVSSVDRAANPGSKILLRKSETDTPTVEIEKQAGALWETAVTLIQKREGCNRSKAVDLAMKDATAREAYDLSKSTYLDRMQKLGDGGLPQNPKVHTPEIGERTTSRTQRSGHGCSPPDDPHDSTAHHVDDGEAFKAYSDAVKEAAQHMRESDAHDYVRKTFPKLWAKVKALKGDKALNEAGALDHAGGRSRTMLPLSED
jgi:hypothetical protein